MTVLSPAGTVFERRTWLGPNVCAVRFDFKTQAYGAVSYARAELQAPLDMVLESLRYEELNVAGPATFTVQLLDEWGIDDLGIAAQTCGTSGEVMLGESLGVSDRRGRKQLMGRHWFYVYLADPAGPRGWVELICIRPGADA